MSVVNLLTETVTVQELTTTQNDMGGMVQTFSTRIGLGSLPCMICSKNVGEVDEFGKRTVRNALMLYCEYSATNATITALDRIVWGSRTFEAKTPYNPAGKDVLFQIELEEIE